MRILVSLGVHHLKTVCVAHGPNLARGQPAHGHSRVAWPGRVAARPATLVTDRPGTGAQGGPPTAAESAGTPSGSRLACGGPASCARTSGWGRGRKSRGARGPRRCVPPAGPAAASPRVPVAVSDGERGKARRPEGRTPGCGPRSQPACSRLQGFLPASSVHVNIRVAAPAAPRSVPRRGGPWAVAQ